MTKTAASQFDAGMIAVIHRTDSTWRGLVANTRGVRPTVVEAKDFPVDAAGRIDGWLDQHLVGQVLCVLPAASVICRNCTLPDAPLEQLQQALSLQAEANLLGMAPPHRLAMAVLPNSNGETSRSGIILAWPESAGFEAPPTSRPVQFVPDIAALAALLNGRRPAEPLIWLDRTDGSVALALTHAGGAVFRGTREDTHSAEHWQKSIGRVVAETGLSVGHTGAYIDTLARGAQQMAATLRPDHSALFLPNEIVASANQRVQGASTASDWWSRYGIALGVVLARSGPLASLTRMLKAPPLETPSIVKSAVSAMSQPKVAIRLAIACVLLLAFGGMLVHGLRWAVLRVRFGNLDDQLRSVTDIKHQLSIYKAMKAEKVKPTTKLLSDIVSNAPEGVQLEMINIDQGSEFTVQGEARKHGNRNATEIIALMQENLNKSGIFNDVVFNWEEPNNMGTCKFRLSAKVVNSFKQFGYDIDHDFQKWTLQFREAGKKPEEGAGTTEIAGGTPSPPTTQTNAIAVNPTPNNGAEEPLPGPGDNTLVIADPPGDTGGDEDRIGDGRPSRDPIRPKTDGPEMFPKGVQPGSTETGATPPSRDPPAAVTQEEVDRMPKDEARAHLSKIVRAEKYVFDEETKSRLKQERQMILTRLRKPE